MVNALRAECGLRLAALFTFLASGAWCSTKEETDTKHCTTEALMACAYPNADQFSFISKKEDLDALCRDLHKGLRCIDEYTRRCLEPAKRSHFNKLYTGTTMVIQEICQEGPYQDEYLRHAPCLREMKENYEVCAKEYNEKFKEMSASSNPNGGEPPVARLCCSLHEYLNCSKDIVLRICGHETAKFASGFLDKMAYSLMEAHCQKYATGSEACLEYNSSSILGISTLAVLLSLMLHLIPS